jgi:hypothetical protein
MRIFEKTHIANGTTTTVGLVAIDKQAVLRYVTINTKAAGATTIYDSAVASTGSVVGVLASNAPEGTYRYDCVMSNGIAVTTTAAVDLTVVYESLN